MSICDFANINNIVKEEKIQLCVISYGGSCSGLLVNTLEKNGYLIHTRTWGSILCHCPEYITLDIPIIYIYDNIIKSYLSVKNRGTGWYDVNQQKLSNNYNVELSDENLLSLMIKQYNSWTEKKDKNVLIIKSNELFEGSILEKLQTFLKNPSLQYFPIKFITPKTNINNMEEKDLLLFQKYKDEIDKINSTL